MKNHWTNNINPYMSSHSYRNRNNDSFLTKIKRFLSSITSNFFYLSNDSNEQDNTPDYNGNAFNNSDDIYSDLRQQNGYYSYDREANECSISEFPSLYGSYIQSNDTKKEDTNSKNENLFKNTNEIVIPSDEDDFRKPNKVKNSNKISSFSFLSKKRKSENESNKYISGFKSINEIKNEFKSIPKKEESRLEYEQCQISKQMIEDYYSKKLEQDKQIQIQKQDEINRQLSSFSNLQTEDNCIQITFKKVNKLKLIENKADSFSIEAIPKINKEIEKKDDKISYNKLENKTKEDQNPLFSVPIISNVRSENKSLLGNIIENKKEEGNNSLLSNNISSTNLFSFKKEDEKTDFINTNKKEEEKKHLFSFGNKEKSIFSKTDINNDLHHKEETSHSLFSNIINKDEEKKEEKKIGLFDNIKLLEKKEESKNISDKNLFSLPLQKDEKKEENKNLSLFNIEKNKENQSNILGQKQSEILPSEDKIKKMKILLLIIKCLLNLKLKIILRFYLQEKLIKKIIHF